MNLAPVLLLASVLAPISGTTDATIHQLRTQNGIDLAGNWSGYALLGKFHEVAGTFTVPPCDGAGQASEWVGVDGYSNSDLLQAGVNEADSVGVGCIINAWWEDLPSVSVDITWLKVFAGDRVRVDIAYQAPSWDIAMTDLATGQTFYQSFTYGGPASSVEWITEAPTAPTGQTNIMPYQSVSWSDLAAYGRAARLSDIWMVQHGAEASVPSTVGTTRQLMREGFSTTFVET